MSQVTIAQKKNEVHHLEAKLGKTCDWLDRNKSHSKYREREEIWIRMLHTYEQSCDDLTAMSEQRPMNLIPAQERATA